MADVSRVEYNDEPLIDLTNDTVTPASLRSGVTAHNAAGDLITGVGGGITTIDDEAGEGDWDKVWSAGKTWEEINISKQYSKELYDNIKIENVKNLFRFNNLTDRELSDVTLTFPRRNVINITGGERGSRMILGILDSAYIRTVLTPTFLNGTYTLWYTKDERLKVVYRTSVVDPDKSLIWKSGETLTFDVPTEVMIYFNPDIYNDSDFSFYLVEGNEVIPVADTLIEKTAVDLESRAILDSILHDYSYQIFKSGKSVVFYQDNNLKNVQGICTDGTYIYAFFPLGDAYSGNSTMVKKIDINGNVKSTNKGRYGLSHANGATYCSTNNKIYVATLGGQDYGGWDPDSIEMGVYNILAIINPETLELENYVNISNELLPIGPCVGSTRIEDPAPHISGIEYIPEQRKFACLWAPHYKSITGQVLYSGVIYLDLDLHLMDYKEWIKYPSYHQGDFFVYKGILYLTTNYTDKNCIALTYDGKMIGNIPIEHLTTKESECACTIDDWMYYTYNTNPNTIEKIQLLPGEKVSVKKVNQNGNLLTVY